jgi:WD40 repeat protein
MFRRTSLLIVAVGTLAASACSGHVHEATPAPSPAARAPVASPTAPSPPRQSSQPPAPAQASLAPLPPGATPSSPGSYLLDTRTGGISRVSDLRGGLWSPDGSAIAFYRCCDGSPGFIDILDLETGATARVASGDVRDLAWSPDSIHLAYVVMDKNFAGLGVYVVDRDGYNPHAAIRDAGAGEPRWQDDRHVAYSRGNPGDVPTFFVVDISRPGTSKRLMPVDPPDPQDPRIVFGFPSSDGVWVVYYEGTYHSDLGQTLAWNSRTGELRVLLPKLALGEFAPGTHAVRLFLPDPEKTGLSMNQIVDLDSGGTSRPVSGAEAHWATGGRLVYETPPCQAETPARSSGLFTLFPDGSDLRRLSTAPGETPYDYAVSPAGPVVAFSASVPGATASYLLHVRALDGPSAKNLDLSLSLNPHLEPGAWSPDGRYLLFSLGTGQGVCG